jgi:tetrahydromethanopterin S-methyltransferase subunit G
MQKDDQAIYEKYTVLDANTGRSFEKLEKRLDRIENKLDKVLYRR